MLCGPSCPRLPSAAVLALRHRLSSPLALDLHHRAEFGTRLSVSDWREPLIRCGAAAAPSAVLETSPAEAPPTSGSPASPTFSSLGLDKRVTAGLAEQGFHAPSEVQAAAIPVILQGRNVGVQSYTGSGKTLAYLLPVLHIAIQRARAEAEGADAKFARKNREQVGRVQALIVAPSRELAMQILRTAQAVLPPAAKGAVQQCIGGANVYRQEEALKLHRPLVVVGTPGRLAELSRAGALLTHHTGLLVLDEADQLLAPQFAADVSRLAMHCGKRAAGGLQTVVVSATLSSQVLQRTEMWCPDPIQVSLNPLSRAEAPPQAGPRSATSSFSAASAPQWGWSQIAHAQGDELAASHAEGSVGGRGSEGMVPAMPPSLQHWHILSPTRHRTDTLRRLIHALDAQRVLVFMNWQSHLPDATAKLQARDMSADFLHGDMGKEERSNVLRRFRAGQLRTLVVSDVMARGLDVPECDAVVNLELPSNAVHYAHRAGRTGRMGRQGTVISIVPPHDQHVVAKLAATLGTPNQEGVLSFGKLLPASQASSQKAVPGSGAAPMPSSAGAAVHAGTPP